MIISDIDYLEPITETSATHLIGGLRFSTLAIANFWVLASGDLTKINTDVENRALTDPNGFYSASSSIKLTSIAPNGVTSASASATASISPTIKPI